MVGHREDLEKQLKQETQALEEQKKRYEDMEVCVCVCVCMCMWCISVYVCMYVYVCVCNLSAFSVAYFSMCCGLSVVIEKSCRAVGADSFCWP